MARTQVAEPGAAAGTTPVGAGPAAAPTETSKPAGGRRYLAALEAAFRDAVRGVGASPVRALSIGPCRVRLEFAGPALVDSLAAALDHLARHDDAPPEVNVSIWDSASTGVPVPGFPWTGEDILARGEIRGYGEEIRIVYEPGFGGVTAFDPASGRGVFWVPSPERVPWYERAAPLRPILHWALAGPGRHLVHAGAVGKSGACVLLAGPGGSGKSTVTLLCASAGLDYLGDDYVLLETERAPTVFSLYGTAKLAPEALARVPLAAAAPGSRGPEEAKLVLDARRDLSAEVSTAAEVRALVLPKITPSGPTRLKAVSSAEALRTLAPSSVLQLPYARTDSLATMATLVRALPAYALELGPDVSAVPALISKLIDDPGACP